VIASFIFSRIHVINIVLWRLIFWCVQNGSCCLRPFWAQVFWGGFKSFVKFVLPYLFVNISLYFNVFNNLKPFNVT